MQQPHQNQNRNKRGLLVCAVSLLCMLLLSVVNAHADPIRFHVVQTEASSETTSIHQAVQTVKERYPGSKVLGATTTQGSSGVVHNIKIITQDGVVKQIRVPAKTR